jgi:hypothetical protein
LKSDFERLVQTRIREARLLLAGGEFDGCYCLTGYAVEAALKACIAKARGASSFPTRIGQIACSPTTWEDCCKRHAWRRPRRWKRSFFGKNGLSCWDGRLMPGMLPAHHMMWPQRF